jgi:hypothetical protein
MRDVKKEILHRGHAQPGERLGALLTDPFQELDGSV